MIKVYGTPNSRSLRINWMLEELGLDYDYQAIDFAKGDNRAPEFLALNPAGKVPVIEDGELVMFESAAIISYLADRYGAGSLIPASGTTERGLYDQWSYFAACELEQPLWTIGKHKFALPAEQRIPEIFDTAGWEFHQALKILSQGLGTNDYLLGDSFSAVDILIAQILTWGISFKQPIEQANLNAYRERMMARPAMTRALAHEKQQLEG